MSLARPYLLIPFVLLVVVRWDGQPASPQDGPDSEPTTGDPFDDYPLALPAEFKEDEDDPLYDRTPKLINASIKLKKRWQEVQKPIRKDLVRESFVQHIRWNSTGKSFATCDVRGAIKLWNPDTSRSTPLPTNLYPSATAVEFHPAQPIVVIGNNGMIMFCNVDKLRAVKFFFGIADGDVLSLAFSADGERIAIGDEMGNVRIWRHSNGEDVVQFRAFKHRVVQLLFSRDGKMLITRGYESIVTEREIRDYMDTVRELKEKGDDAARATYTRIAAEFYDKLARQDATIKIWDSASGKPIARTHMEAIALSCMALSCDGRTMVVGNYAGSVGRYAVQTAKNVGILPQAHPWRVSDVAITPDGNLVISAGYDGVVKVVDAGSFETRATIHEDNVISIDDIAISPNGRTLITAGRYRVDDDIRSAVTAWDLVIEAGDSEE